MFSMKYMAVKNWLFFAIAIALCIDLHVCTRKKSTTKGDESSSGSITPLERDNKEPRRVSVQSHVEDRLLRFVRFAGFVQNISHVTGIDRIDVIKPDASEYQDLSSHTEGFHAAHLVRGKDINSRIIMNFPSIYSALRNFVGHTQKVPKFINEYAGAGGDMDKVQKNYFNLLVSNIDFNTPINETTKGILSLYKESFVKILDLRIKEEKLSKRIKADEKTELAAAINLINNTISVDYLYTKGEEGYKGVHLDAYID